jgi:hypothetical protein
LLLGAIAMLFDDDDDDAAAAVVDFCLFYAVRGSTVWESPQWRATKSINYSINHSIQTVSKSQCFPSV